MSTVEIFYDGVHTATVTTPLTGPDALEFAFMATQNLEGSWSKPGNPDWRDSTTVVAPLRVHNGHIYGHRSSMMGDRFVLDGTPYEVASFGFKVAA